MERLYDAHRYLKRKPFRFDIDEGGSKEGSHFSVVVVKLQIPSIIIIMIVSINVHMKVTLYYGSRLQSLLPQGA